MNEYCDYDWVIISNEKILNMSKHDGRSGAGDVIEQVQCVLSPYLSKTPKHVDK